MEHVFDVDKSNGRRVFFHGHCQQKTIDAVGPTIDLLRRLGFDVATSSAECCGMAGSFGYKREYHELSTSVGQDLFNQIQRAETSADDRIILASGISCYEQIHAGTGRPVLHPMELLAGIML